MEDTLMDEIEDCIELTRYDNTIFDNEEFNETPPVITNNIHVIASTDNIVLTSRSDTPFEHNNCNMNETSNDISLGNCFTITKPQPVKKYKNNINFHNICVDNNKDVSGNNYSFCSICGLNSVNHYNETHRFFRAFDLHRCIHCNKFFYQHDHSSNPCWKPYKYL